MSFIGLVLVKSGFFDYCFDDKKRLKKPYTFKTKALKQKRYGKDKKFFYIYKFRTMYTDIPKDMPTHLLQDPSKCITKVGAFLRKTSLDELP